MTTIRMNEKKIVLHYQIFVLLQRVSLIRPAPGELPQVRKEARVAG